MRARALLVLLALPGCGTQAAADRRAAGGFTVWVPAGWHAAPQLTHGLPSLTVASFTIRPGATSDSCIPRRVLRAMPPDGALLFAVHHRDKDPAVHDVPPPPAAAVLREPATSAACFGRSRVAYWSARRRVLLAALVLGPDAPPQRRRELAAAFDSLRVRG